MLPQPGVSNTELLEAVLRAEMLSEHPIARAIVRHAEEEGLEFADLNISRQSLGVVFVPHGMDKTHWLAHNA